MPNSDELILGNEDFEREYNEHNGTLRTFLVYRWWDLTHRDRFVACRSSSCTETTTRLFPTSCYRHGNVHNFTQFFSQNGR